MIALALLAALFCQTPEPSPEVSAEVQKQVAQSAIAAARAAIDHSKTPEKKEEAHGRLKQAEGLFEVAKYSEAAKAADAAWRIVSDTKTGPTAFAVEVSENGKTKVTSVKGQPVRVEAEGVTQPLYAGQIVSVEKGEKPVDVITPVVIATPEIIAPKPNERFKLKASQKLSRPIAVSWTAVSNAHGYEVEVRAAEGEAHKPVLLKALKTKTKLPPLPPGKYLWAVRAVGRDGVTGTKSEERGFELVRDNVKIEVQGTKWK